MRRSVWQMFWISVAEDIYFGEVTGWTCHLYSLLDDQAAAYYADQDAPSNRANP